MPGLLRFGNWNENNLNPLSRINWRASLVPAAAVIPAPIAYIKVVAVKKLVVEFPGSCGGRRKAVLLDGLRPFSEDFACSLLRCVRDSGLLL